MALGSCYAEQIQAYLPSLDTYFHIEAPGKVSLSLYLLSFLLQNYP